MNHHAKRAYRLIETSLHQLHIRLEMTISTQDGYGVFIDLEEAFANAWFESMVIGVRERGPTSTVVRLIGATFEKRLIVMPGNES